MKYMMKNDDGTFSLGRLKEDWEGFDFEKEQVFSDEQDLRDYLYDNKIANRELMCVYTVIEKFLNDLAKRADDTRTRRDEFATKADITIICRSHYERNHNLECYGSDFGSGFDLKGDTESNSIPCRQFFAEHNYLLGLADGAWELGFTLVFNTDTGKHEFRGNRKKYLIGASEYQI